MTRQVPSMSKLRKGFLIIGMILLITSFFFFFLSSRLNWDYVTTQEKTVTIGYPTTAVKNYGFGDSYAYPVPKSSDLYGWEYGLEIDLWHSDYLTVKCSSENSQQPVYVVLANFLAANDTAYSYHLGSLTHTDLDDIEFCGLVLAVPTNQSKTNTTVTVTFTLNHYETPQWVYFGFGVVLSLLAVIPIFKSKS